MKLPPDVRIGPATPDGAWDDVVRADGGLVFASQGYLSLIEEHLAGSEPRHFGAWQGERLVAVLPSLLRCVPELGCVNNSSPFFGSHGGVYTTFSGSDREHCVAELLRQWLQVCEEDGCTVSNLVEPLGNRDKEVYESMLPPWRTDERVGQVVHEISEDSELNFQRFHQKTRNMVRKAQRSGVQVREDRAALGFLHEVHAENMAALGGKPKPLEFFESLTRHLGDDWTVHLARVDDAPVAALLMLYFGDCAEYYTPVTRADFRTLQPMSLLVLEAMTEAARRGCTRFNFGGTWHAQDGVYRFKSRFGADDVPYRYYVLRHREESPLLAAEPERLRTAFDGYYLYPM